MSSHIACKSDEYDENIAQKLEEIYQVITLDVSKFYFHLHSPCGIFTRCSLVSFRCL